MKALILFVVLAFTGCATPGPLAPSQLQTIETACASASLAQKVLVEAITAGKVSEDAQAKIRAASVAIQPVCGAPNPPTLDSLQMQAFQQAVLLLATQAKEN